MRSLLSSDEAIKRPPIELKREMPSSLIAPRLSKASGTNVCEAASWLYFCFLLTAACSAARPAFKAEPARLEAARVSGHVTSQAIHFPWDHGTMEQPSGLSDEPGIRPDGSLDTGMPALLNALSIISLTSK